jgi:hypothetical protein
VPPPRTKHEQKDIEPATPRLEEIQARLDELTTEVRDLRDKVSRESTRRRYPFPFGKRSTADQRCRKPG